MTDIPLQECKRCKNLHPETLYSGRDGFCVYCKADEVESIPAAAVPVEEEQEAQSVEDKARAEARGAAQTREARSDLIKRRREQRAPHKPTHHKREDAGDI